MKVLMLYRCFHMTQTYHMTTVKLTHHWSLFLCGWKYVNNFNCIVILTMPCWVLWQELKSKRSCCLGPLARELFEWFLLNQYLTYLYIYHFIDLRSINILNCIVRWMLDVHWVCGSAFLCFFIGSFALKFNVKSSFKID